MHHHHRHHLYTDFLSSFLILCCHADVTVQKLQFSKHLDFRVLFIYSSTLLGLTSEKQITAGGGHVKTLFQSVPIGCTDGPFLDAF